mgnify:CR=1 FL=1
MEKMLFSGVQSNSEVALIAIKGIQKPARNRSKSFWCHCRRKNQRGTDPSVHRTWRE